MAPQRTALIVMTSHDKLGDTGRSTGAYIPEVAHAWQVFAAAGYTVELASVLGGKPPLDAVDWTDPVQKGFLEDPEMSAKLAATQRPEEADDGHDVLFFAGGHGAAWDFPDHAALADLTRRSYERGGVVAAVCHGPAALVNVTLGTGRYLVDGRQVAAFSNDEERAIGMTEVVPFLLADRLIERGADYVPGPTFVPHVVVDERLVTGQNPPSSALVAEEAVQAAGRA